MTIFNHDESEYMSPEEIGELLAEWEWDALTGRFQDYVIRLRQDHAAAKNQISELLEGLLPAINGIDLYCYHCATSFAKAANEVLAELGIPWRYRFKSAQESKGDCHPVWLEPAKR